MNTFSCIHRDNRDNTRHIRRIPDSTIKILLNNEKSRTCLSGTMLTTMHRFRGHWGHPWPFEVSIATKRGHEARYLQSMRNVALMPRGLHSRSLRSSCEPYVGNSGEVPRWIGFWVVYTDRRCESTESTPRYWYIKQWCRYDGDDM